MKHPGEKQNLLLIGNLHSHPSAEANLRKSLRILYFLCNNVALISGDLPSEPTFKNKIQWTETKDILKGEEALFKVINFILKQLRVTIVMAKLFRRSDFNTILFLTSPPVPLLFAKVMKKKIVLYKGGSYSKNLLHNRKSLKGYLLTKIFEGLPFVLSDKIIIEGKSSLKFQNLEKYKDKVVIGSLYVDKEVFMCKKRMPERKEKVGYIGIINKNKGVDMFCKAITMITDYLEEKDIAVIIIGDGLLLSSVKEIIKKNNLYNRVTFTGWIPHEELSDYLNEIKLLVIPSYTEGLPNIILEAMACGTPVLATPVGSVPDVIKDEKTGFILENNSPECIAKNIERALNYPNLDEIAENARRLVEREFTYEAAVERYRKILDNLGIENYGQRKII